MLSTPRIWTDHTVLLILFETDLHNNQTENSRSTKCVVTLKEKYLINQDRKEIALTHPVIFCPVVTNILF